MSGLMHGPLTKKRIHDRIRVRIHIRIHARIHERIHSTIHERIQARIHPKIHETDPWLGFMIGCVLGFMHRSLYGTMQSWTVGMDTAKSTVEYRGSQA